MSEGPLPTLYGIPNCDQVKKARTWLDAHGIAYRFHDFKKEGLAPAVLNQWLAQVNWESLLNRRGTTWRALPDARKAAIATAPAAAQLMLESLSVVKRPVRQVGRLVTVGFDAGLYQSLLA